jgi:hypothetical protein
MQYKISCPNNTLWSFTKFTANTDILNEVKANFKTYAGMGYSVQE